jgi:hypothetical protein
MKDTNFDQLVDEWHEKIRKITSTFKALDEEVKKWEKLGALSPDSKLHEQIFLTFEIMLAAVDNNGWIYWHIFENDFGAKELLVCPYGDDALIRVSNDRDLAIVIAKGVARF